MVQKLFAVILALLSSLAVAGTHYEANYCEIFIDRLGASGSGGYEGKEIHVLLKLYPSRLDSSVKRVGSSSPDSEINQISDDYYDVLLNGSASQGLAFFVETQKGTYYWVNQNHESGNNFVFDERLFDSIREQGRLEQVNGSLTWFLRPADFGDDSFGLYNPGGCR